MSIRQAPTSDFDTNLTQLLPRLRVYAMSLTRDPSRADDLVQETVMRSLAGRKSFRPGTNFPGWLFRIQRNEFISDLRHERPTGTFGRAFTLPFPVDSEKVEAAYNNGVLKVTLPKIAAVKPRTIPVKVGE